MKIKYKEYMSNPNLLYLEIAVIHRSPGSSHLLELLRNWQQSSHRNRFVLRHRRFVLCCATIVTITGIQIFLNLWPWNVPISRTILRNSSCGWKALLSHIWRNRTVSKHDKKLIIFFVVVKCSFKQGRKRRKNKK